MKTHSRITNPVSRFPSARSGRALHQSGAAALLLILAAAVDVSAVTNTYTSSSNFPGAYVISPSANTTQVDIWAVANGASFNVTSNLLLNPAAGAIATVLMDGSTNSIDGIGSTISLNTLGAGTSMVSLVNNAFLVVTNYTEINSSGVGILSLSNSTMKVTQAVFIDYNGGGVGTCCGSNLLIMFNSVLDMGSQGLTIQDAGKYAAGSLRNSVITNANGITIAQGGFVGVLTASNSSITTVGSYSGRIGSGNGTSGSLLLDQSTLTGANSYELIGDNNGTGVVNLVNGSLISHPGETPSLGARGMSYGVVNVTNSTWNVGTLDAGGWAGVGGAEAYTYGHGEVNLYNGTNVITTKINLGSSTNSFGTYSAAGASLVVAPAIVAGFGVNSTGTFTMAGSSSVFVTNAAYNAPLTVGAGGKGTFIMNGGTLNVDKLLVSNGASSTFTFNGGTLNTRSTIVSNGVALVVGDGTDLATLSLLGGTHIFASGLTIAQNATLMGTGTVQGATTVFGTLSPGFSPGPLHITGGLTLAANATNAVDINGPTVGTQYDQVDVTGAVSVAGSVLSITLGYNPSTGTVFTIINNDGIDPVTGTFAGLPNGFEFSVAGMSAGHAFNIRYNGGTGNDVTLQVVPEPSIAGLLSISALVLGIAARAQFRRNQ